MVANCNRRERNQTTKRRYDDGMDGSLAVDCSNCRVRNGGRARKVVANCDCGQRRRESVDDNSKRGSWNVEGRVIILIIAEFPHHPAPNALRKRFSIAVLSSTKQILFPAPELWHKNDPGPRYFGIRKSGCPCPHQTVMLGDLPENRWNPL